MRLRHRWCSTFAAVALLLSGCMYDAQEPDQYNCSDEHPQCPEGLICNGTTCVQKGSEKDSGVADATIDLPVEDGDSPDAPQEDATVDAGTDVAQEDAAGDAPLDAPLDLDSDAPSDSDADVAADLLLDTGCPEGTVQNCYEGDPITEGIGLCKGGEQICANGTWGTCFGQITPKTEICDDADNDCDGQTDEDLVQNCYTDDPVTEGVGLCKAGTQTCVGGDWSTCTGEVTPVNEVCDGVDNDCDGQTDEGCSCMPGDSQDCGSDVGECQHGSQICDSSGGWGDCENEVTAEDETCDGLDNDCDGVEDNILPEECYTAADPSTEGVGLCHSGTRSCSNGDWGPCVGQVTPVTESCDGLDNDCDGVIDDNPPPQLCPNQLGVCAGAAKTCDGANGWQPCTSTTYAIHAASMGLSYQTSETYCDGQDNDCDGLVDDNLPPQLCSNQQGVCAGAVKTCDGANGWQPCTDDEYATRAEDQGQVYQQPNETLCDGDDNDCDGQTDESLKVTYYPDVDNDNWGDEDKPQEYCPGDQPSSYVSTGEDCDDDDPDVHPQQTTFYTKASTGNGTWDYNCDGTIETDPPPANCGNCKLMPCLCLDLSAPGWCVAGSPSHFNPCGEWLWLTDQCTKNISGDCVADCPTALCSKVSGCVQIKCR